MKKHTKFYFMLLIMALLISGCDKDSKDNISPEKNIENNTEVDYTSKEETEEVEEEVEEEAEFHEDNPHGEDYSYMDTDKADGEEVRGLAPPLEDTYGKEEMKQAKETAEKFIEAHFNFDGDDPSISRDNAREFTTERYSTKLEEDVPTHNHFTRKFISSEYHVTNFRPRNKNESIQLVYRVKGEEDDFLEENKRGLTQTYILRMKLEDGEYKVNNFGINLPFD